MIKKEEKKKEIGEDYRILTFPYFYPLLLSIDIKQGNIQSPSWKCDILITSNNNYTLIRTIIYTLRSSNNLINL